MEIQSELKTREPSEYCKGGNCAICKLPFSFHSNKVPSLNGKPICKKCVDTFNIIQKHWGRPPILYASDAYEGADENSINWNGKPKRVKL